MILYVKFKINDLRSGFLNLIRQSKTKKHLPTSLTIAVRMNIPSPSLAVLNQHLAMHFINLVTYGYAGAVATDAGVDKAVRSGYVRTHGLG